MLTKKQLKKQVAKLQSHLESINKSCDYFEKESAKFEKAYYKEIVKNVKLQGELREAREYIDELKFYLDVWVVNPRQ